MKNFKATALLLLSTAALSVGAAAQISNELQTLSYSSAGSDNFGIAIDIEGDTAVIGAPGYNGNVGHALVYQKSGTTWSQVAVLSPSGTNPVNAGSSVAISGNFIVVGAPLSGPSGTGSAFVYTCVGGVWSSTPTATLGAGVSGTLPLFGQSVAVDGNRVIVGAPGNTVGGTANCGSAFAYQWNGTSWSFPAAIAPSGGYQANAHHGTAVAIAGNEAVVTADNQSGGAGTAFLYHHNGTAWAYAQTLNPSGGGKFGTAAALDATTLVVGAPYDSTVASAAGAAYLYRLSGGTWTLDTKVTDPNGQVSDVLGYHVAVSGDAALIGAPMFTLPQQLPGFAHLLRRAGTNWYPALRLERATGQNNSGFGVVGLSGENALIGAWNQDVGGTVNLGETYYFGVAGQAYGFCASGGPACNTSYSTGGCPNITGVGGRLIGTGASSVAADTFGLIASQLPPSTGGNTYTGLFFMGPSSAFAINGSGIQVVAQPLRFPTITTGTGIVTMNNMVSQAQTQFGGANNILPGSTWYFQFWYRGGNVGCANTTNLTNGVQTNFTN